MSTYTDICKRECEWCRLACALLDSDRRLSIAVKAIQDAPCTANCRSKDRPKFSDRARALQDLSCNCWKSRALAELGITRNPWLPVLPVRKQRKSRCAH